MSDDCWMLDNLNSHWNWIESDNDLKTLAQGGTGWRSQQPGGGGRNFKTQDNEFIFRDRDLTLGDTPSIALVPSVANGEWHGSAGTADLRLGIRYECRIFTDNVDKVLKFCCVVLKNIISAVNSKFSVEPDHVNLIERYFVPTINFEDFSHRDDNLWGFSIPLVTEINFNYRVND